MTILDSHCHPQFPQYDNDREEMLRRARDAGVSMICVGTDLETSQKGIELAQKWSNPPSPDGFGEASMWATVGCHPNDINRQLTTDNLQQFEELLTQPKVVAVGEVGLDYYRTPEPEKQEQQKEVLRRFIDLATKHKKPLILHCRDSAKGSAGHAYFDMFEILKAKSSQLKAGGVFHSFTGTPDEARKAISLGFYIGFNGILTFTDQYNESVKATPLEKILLETDAPFLAPEPYRGKRNEPAYVVEVAKKITELKGKDYETIVRATTESAMRLFVV